MMKIGLFFRFVLLRINIYWKANPISSHCEIYAEDADQIKKSSRAIDEFMYWLIGSTDRICSSKIRPSKAPFLNSVKGAMHAQTRSKIRHCHKFLLQISFWASLSIT